MTETKVYLFKEGYVRTSSESYNIDISSLDQIYVHLTNNAVQKYSKSFGMYEEANIVSVKLLCDDLAQDLKVTGDELKSIVYERIEEQVVESVLAVKHLLKLSRNSFELLGYDFMLT